jgi:hypothetical protein
MAEGFIPEIHRSNDCATMDRIHMKSHQKPVLHSSLTKLKTQNNHDMFADELWSQHLEIVDSRFTFHKHKLNDDHDSE